MTIGVQFEYRGQEYNEPCEFITDAFEFASKIHELGKCLPKEATGALWFRGQADGCWCLRPPVARKHTFGGEELPRSCTIEYDLLNRFRRYAYTFLKRELTLWENITLAAHHGLPTRLLDWTSNPLVALYFAASEHIDKDGAVFVFRRREPRFDLSVYEIRNPNQRCVANPLYVKGVKIVYPMIVTERIVTQSAGFTIQCPWLPLEERAKCTFHKKDLDIHSIVKYRIPGCCKPHILKQLERVAINRRTLFPDLDGIAKGILHTEILRLRST